MKNYFEKFMKQFQTHSYNDDDNDKIDTKKKKLVSTGDILVEKGQPRPPQAVLHDRLFILQNAEGKFGNIMCINADTKNPIEYIFNMLTNEIKRTEKFAEKETEQGKMVLHQAIQNICNLSIYEIKPELDVNTKEPIFTFNKITEYKGA